MEIVLKSDVALTTRNEHTGNHIFQECSVGCDLKQFQLLLYSRIPSLISIVQ